jgi:hypothetical protein
MFKTRTFIALGLLVVLGGLAVLKLSKKDDGSVGVAKAPVAAFTKDGIDELSIEEPGKPAVVLKKEGAEWRLTAPVADRADQKNAEAAIEALTLLRWRDVIAEHEASHAALGVKADEVVKVIPKKGGQPLATLLLGKGTNVRVGDAPQVWAVADLRRFNLVREPKQWRDREILHLPKDKLDRVTVATAKGTVTVKREPAPAPPAPEAPAGSEPKPAKPPGPDKWTVVEGQDKVGGDLDVTMPQGIASLLERLDADEFPDAVTDAAAGLDTPASTVTAHLTDGTKRIILVGKDEGDHTFVKLQDAPRIWKIRKLDGERLKKGPAQWRDKQVAKISPETLTRVEVQQGTDRYVLVRVDDKTWKAAEPKTLTDLDQVKVQPIIGTLNPLRAQAYIDELDVIIGKPTAFAIFTAKDGTKTTLTIGDLKDGFYAAALSGKPQLFTISEAQAKRFLKKPAELQKTEAPPAPPL